MSAARAAAGFSLDDEKRAHEPSMEEILASIRRIIADDQYALEGNAGDYGTDARAARAATDVEAAERERIAMLRRLRAATDIPPGSALSEERAVSAPPPRRVSEAPTTNQPSQHERLSRDVVSGVGGAEVEASRASSLAQPMVSQTTSAAVVAQFEKLALSRIFEDSGRLEGLVSELLRPMLQQWLDDNLPVIVERLVRAEIERVARSGRG